MTLIECPSCKIRFDVSDTTGDIQCPRCAKIIPPSIWKAQGKLKPRSNAGTDSAESIFSEEDASESLFGEIRKAAAPTVIRPDDQPTERYPREPAYRDPPPLPASTPLPERALSAPGDVQSSDITIVEEENPFKLPSSVEVDLPPVSSAESEPSKFDWKWIPLGILFVYSVLMTILALWGWFGRSPESKSPPANSHASPKKSN